jgi:hypothetical protein
MTVPVEVLISFFQNAKERLEKYTYDPQSSSSYGDGDEYIPIPMRNHQQYLLNEQIIVLNEVVNDYNNNSDNHSNIITAQDVQDSLRLLGSTTNSNTTNNDTSNDDDNNDQNKNEDQFKKATKGMKEMNDIARMAFCKSILASEYYWYQQQKQKQVDNNVATSINNSVNVNSENNDHMVMMLDYKKVNRDLFSDNDNDNVNDNSINEMDRQATLEFCGLCTTAIKIPQVQTYIHTGNMNFLNDLSHNENINDTTTDTTESKVDATISPQQRISHLQQMILCALGYEPSYGGKKIQMQMLTNNHNDDDAELNEAFATFIVTIQETTKEAMNINLQEHKDTLSDEKEGGVTRVVAVNYSEREIRSDGREKECANCDPTPNTNTNGEAPSNQRMEEQNEDVQREQMQMAKRAAQLQQSIMNELLSMKEDERKVCLLDAKNAHECFLKDALALPPMERVVFMQNVDAGLQKKLLMYKLWESQGQGRI